MFFITEEAKETILDFLQGTVKVLWIFFTLIYYQYRMTQYNTLNLKLSHSQLNELKSGTKNGTEVALKLSSDVVGDSNDAKYFLHKLLLINARALRHCKAFSCSSSASIKLTTTQLHKIGKITRIFG